MNLGKNYWNIGDKEAQFLETVKKIDDIAVLTIDPKLSESQFYGLRSYSEGFVKEGAGAGGSLIASVLKTGRSPERLLELIEKEYQRISTLQ